VIYYVPLYSHFAISLLCSAKGSVLIGSLSTISMDQSRDGCWEIKNKTVCVTGATSGIGRCYIAYLAQACVYCPRWHRPMFASNHIQTKNSLAYSIFSNSLLCRETAASLAGQGARVILAVRDLTRGHATAAAIRCVLRLSR